MPTSIGALQNSYLQLMLIVASIIDILDLFVPVSFTIVGVAVGELSEGHLVFCLYEHYC